MAIHFACACGRQIKARDKRAGRRMRCPNCQTIVTVPEASDGGQLPDLAEELSRLSRKPRREAENLEDIVPSLWPQLAEALNPWVDRSLEQRVTPWDADDEQHQGRTHERPSSKLFLWAVVLMLLLLSGIGAAAWYYWPDDLTVHADWPSANR